MKNVVTIIDGELRLCSGLGEYAFGKTNYNSVVTQQGLLAQCDSESDKPLHFSFTSWSFTDIKSYDVEDNEERIVFYCAQNPFSKNARTLFELYAQAGDEQASVKNKDEMYNASFSVCAALTQAAKEGIDIPVNGAEGILVDGNNLLFLPHDVFIHSVAGLNSVEQSDLNNCWINPTLTNLPAICFLRATIAYKMLTGRFAYPAADTLTRNADILDKNFLPLELSVNGINQELATAVNKALKLNSNSVSIPGKKPKGKKSEELIPQPDFPLDLLANAKETTSATLSDKEFEEKVNNYKKMQGSRVNTSRTLRRNTTAIMIGIIALISVIFIIRGSYKSYLDEYTTKGLTSVQTIQAFFKGMNTMDVTMMENSGKGKAVNRYIDAVSNVYVISKQRQSNGGDAGYIKPAKFFLTVTESSKLKLAGLYGVTCLSIDGKQTDEYVDIKKNIDKPAALTTEQGITLQKDDKSVHSVEYYTLHTEGTNNDIYITKNKDIFTLTYKKDKWIITNIETSQETIDLDSNKFKTEYFKRVQENDWDVVKTIRELSLSYDFLPSQKEMTIEKQILDEYIANPYKDIF